MTAEEFVNNCYKEKQEILNIYFDSQKETQVGNQIKISFQRYIKR